MEWLKHAWIDLGVTAFILAVAVVRPEWAWWVLGAYTGFMLVLKVLALSGGAIMALGSKPDQTPPLWFYHVLYAVNVGALAWARWWALAGMWAVIWALSAVAAARETRSPAAAARKTRRPS